MAARTPVEKLRDEARCSICLEIFQDPVSIHCGHSFCRSCITGTWEGLTTNFSCPQCREMVFQKSFRPNWELANVIEAAKRLNVQPVREVEGGENFCEEHQEPLKLFCQDDKRLICVVCDRSKLHRDHSVVPVGEAAQQYKKQIQTQLHRLKSEQEALQSSVKDRQDRIKDHTERTEAAKQEIVRTYRKMHEILEKQESSLLAQLEQLDTEIRKAHEEILQRLLEETTRLGTLLGEMERTYQQPDWELLKDIGTTLSRGQRETLSPSLDISLELEQKFSAFTENYIDIKEVLEKFQDFLEFELPLTKQRDAALEWRNFLLTENRDVVTLDPNTAHPILVLSEDLRSVKRGPAWQNLPDTPERFSYWFCVLGRERFREGRHCWEVEVKGEVGDDLWWGVGVARETVERKTKVLQSPEEGIWAVGHGEGQFKAFTSPRTPLFLSPLPRRIWVCLDCTRGLVTFLNADTGGEIFTFPPASFQGETLRPWFRLGSFKTQLCLRGSTP